MIKLIILITLENNFYNDLIIKDYKFMFLKQITLSMLRCTMIYIKKVLEVESLKLYILNCLMNFRNVTKKEVIPVY